MRHVIVAIIALLLVPGVSARAPVEGAFDATSVWVDGDGSVTAPSGILSLAGRLDGVALRWTSAEVWEVERYQNFTGVWGDGATDPLEGEPLHDRYEWAEGSLSDLSCSSWCEIALFTWAPGEGELGIAGRATGTLVASKEERMHYSTAPDPDSPDSFVRASPAGTPLFRAHVGGEGLAISGGAPAASGRLGLLLWNAKAVLAQGGELSPIVTGTSSSEDAVPGAVDVQKQLVRRFLVVTMEGAVLEAPPGTGAVLEAPSPTLALAGSLRGQDAEGWIRVGPQRHELQDDRILVVGDLQNDVPHTAVLATLGGSWAVGLRGEADRVAIAGADIPTQRATSFTTAPVETVGTIALLLLLASLGLLAFYTRIYRGDVLENPTRRRVYEAIQARPGRDVAEIARELSLARPVARHHLAMLLAQKLITERREGRSRRHFPIDVGASALGWHPALADATRREVARAILLSAAPPTQRELMATTSLSQRLVSYHTRKLAGAGLLRVEATLPQRYVALPELAQALGASAAQPQAAGSA